MDNQRIGFGILIEANGNIYQGNWVNNKRNGQGKLIYANGAIYDGGWKNDNNGHGKLRYGNGEVYEGEWINNKKNGEGTYEYNNNNSYEGSWKDNIKSGRGMLFIQLEECYTSVNAVGNWKRKKSKKILLFILIHYSLIVLDYLNLLKL